MSLIEVLLHPYIGCAFIAYSIVALSLMLTVEKIADYADDLPASQWWCRSFSHWLLQHLWIPLIQIIGIVVFLLIAYPILFGLKTAPGLMELLTADTRGPGIIFGLFMLSLVLPLIPVIGNRQAFVLPLQGIAAVLLLFSKLLILMPATDIIFWPGFLPVGVLLIFAVLSHAFAQHLSKRVGHGLDQWLNHAGWQEIALHLILLLCQAPIILYYAVFLGNQLS